MAQSVEHMLGKHEVPGPNPGSSSSSAYGNRIFPVAVFCFLQAVQARRQPVRPASGAPPVPAPDAGVSLTRWLRHGLMAADERGVAAFLKKGLAKNGKSRAAGKTGRVCVINARRAVYCPCRRRR